MSVPTHNLYDFIYQAIKKKAHVACFYPWGEKKLSNLIWMSPVFDDKKLEKIHKHNIFFKKNLPRSCTHYIPTMICYDQEPLYFDLYSNEQIKDVVEKEKKENPLYSFSLLNLRTKCFWNWHKYCILLHSERQSSELEKYLSTGQYVGVHWFSHAFIARDWFRFAEFDDDLNPSSDVKKIFLAYCRDATGSRLYRKEFLKNINEKKIDKFCQLTSFNLDENISSDSSAIYNRNDFNCSMISVVLETVFDDRIHLTEKTMRSIACGHPFILFNGPGALKYLRSYGFKTFHPYINESYDDIFNTDLRMESICQEILRISQLSDIELCKLNKNLKKISDYNKKHFFSKKFYNHIISELQNNFNIAFEKTCYNMNWNLLWNDYKKRKQVNSTYYQENKNERKLILTLLRHLKKGGTLEDYVPPDLD